MAVIDIVCKDCVKWVVVPDFRRFILYREEDLSGISGTGLVAFGIEYPNKKCTLSWNGTHSSTGYYDSIEDLIYIHGHENKTRVVWIDA